MKNTKTLLSNGLDRRFLTVLALLSCLRAFPLGASVVGWGTNDYGQLTIPTNSLVGARAVAAGGWHGLAVTISNTAVAWGVNDYGQTNVPANLTGVVAVAGGYDHSLALTTNGTIIGWGITSNLYYGDPEWFGQADVPADVTNAVAVSAGALHSLALKSDGTVEAWGYDFYGQCDVPAGLSNVTAIACGGYFSLALKNDGTVVAWGDNYYGQTNLPADLTNVIAIATGGLHGLALKSDGTVEGWGARGVTDFTQDFGQENAPADLTNAVAIAAGFYHSLALKSDGTVRQWGDTSRGQTNPPAGLNSVSSIAGGYAHSYGLKNDVPIVVTPTTNVVTATNRAVSFVVGVNGSAPIRATWFQSGLSTNLGSVVLSNTMSSYSFGGGSILGGLATNLGATYQSTLFLYATYPALTTASTNTFYVVLTNALGAVTSSVANLTVLLPPKITSQPVNVATNVGATVFFTVGNTGSQPMSYTWLFNGTPLNVANPTNVLELDNVNMNSAGAYQVVISNAVGSVTSSNAYLTVGGSPAILVQPTNTTVVAGSNAAFNVSVSGALPLTYQWYFYQTNTLISALPDGTNANYTVVNAQTNNAGKYFLVVSNSFNSATSSVATLTVLTPPLILTQPTNVVTATNRAVSFVVGVNGNVPIRATWWQSGMTTNLGSVVVTNTMTSYSFGGGSIQGGLATNLGATYQSTLFLSATYPALTSASTNTFYVVLTNALGVVTSSVANLTVLLPPKITSQPVNVATNVGATVFFTVGNTGSQPMSYTWLFNGTPLNVANPTNVLELDNVGTTSAGRYQVVVSNAVGSVTSSNAYLTVDGSPLILVQPTNATVVVGSNAAFNVSVSGALPLTYQWYFYQTNTLISALPDGTNADYTVVNAQTNNAGKYFLVASNTFNSVTSSVVTLTVLTPPLILTQPADVVTATNRAVSFVVGVNGSVPIRATWFQSGLNTNLGSVVLTNTMSSYSFGGGSILGGLATNLGATYQSSLSLQATYPALMSAGTNTFYVVLTNALGAVTSSVANLTVLLPPKITSQPVNVATNVGATVFFTVGNTGSQPMSYTWLFNGTPLNVANPSNVLELDNVDTNSAGSYQVLVSNAVGSVTSSSAVLYFLVNGSLTPPQLWLLSHDPTVGDGMMIALEAGRNYRVQSSTDLAHWNDFTNFLSQSSLVVFTNSQYSNLPAMYYRVVTP